MKKNIKKYLIVSTVAIIMIIAIVIVVNIVNKTKLFEFFTIFNNKPKSIVIDGMDDYEYFMRNIEGDNGEPGGYIDAKKINRYNNKKYFVYVKNKYLGSTILETVEELDGSISLKNKLRNKYDENEILEILVDTKYNAIPRKSKPVTLSDNIKNNIPEISDYDNYEAEKIDLDGDNKYEYIIAFKKKKNNKISTSHIIIVDEKGEKATNSTMENVDHLMYYSYDDSKSSAYIELKDLTYIDLNHDGKMEIIAKCPYDEDSRRNGLPMYEVFKYEDKKIID